MPPQWLWPQTTMRADVQVEHRELDRRGGAVVAGRAVVRRHEGADVAHQEQLARPGAGEQVRHQARIGTADEQRRRVLAVVDQRLELRAVLREGVVVKAPQPFAAVRRASSRPARGAYCTSGVSAASRSTPSTRALAGQQLQVLAQRGDEGLLAQRLRHAPAHGLERRRRAGLARQHLDHVQPEAAVHQARQHADLGVAEHLARELGRAVGARRASPARRPRRRSGSWTAAPPRAAKRSASPSPSWQRRSSRQASARLRRASTSTPGVTANSTWRSVHALADAVARRHGRREWRRQASSDGSGSASSRSSSASIAALARFADRAVARRRIVGGEQAGPHRRLAQQLGAGALAQFVGGQHFAARHAAPRR